MSENNQAYGYSEYGDYNRLSNLDSIETLIVDHLLNSDSSYAHRIWKLLKYNDFNALVKGVVEHDDRASLINDEEEASTSKRVFITPFIDDAFKDQCSAIFIYVEDVFPINRMQSNVEVTVETVTHSKLGTIKGDYDYENKKPGEEEILRPLKNPNDTDEAGNCLVNVKNRETVLVKNVIAELNGLYLNGIGYLSFDGEGSFPGSARMNLYKGRSFFGHTIKFILKMGNVSSTSTDDDIF